MSVNNKQLTANKQNARKSTGPKTDTGKAALSQNATKHGLYSRSAVINSPHLKEGLGGPSDDSSLDESRVGSRFSLIKYRRHFTENNF